MNNCGGGLVSSSTRSEGGKNVTKKYLNSITLKNQLEIWVDIEGESKFYSNCISNLSAFRVSNLPSRIWSSFIFNCLWILSPPSSPFIGGVVKLIRCDSILLFTGQQLTAVNKRTDSSSVSHWVVILKCIEHFLTKLFFTWLQILLSNIKVKVKLFFFRDVITPFSFFSFFIWLEIQR